MSILKFKENPAWSIYSNEFAFQGVVYKIDGNGFWSIGSTLYWGKPWINSGKLYGAIIDPKFKEEIELLNSTQQMQANMNWLNTVSNDKSVTSYSFPGRAHICRETKPCSHVSWSDRAKDHVCSQCSTYHIEKAGVPIVCRTSD